MNIFDPKVSSRFNVNIQRITFNNYESSDSANSSKKHARQRTHAVYIFDEYTLTITDTVERITYNKQLDHTFFDIITCCGHNIFAHNQIADSLINRIHMRDYLIIVNANQCAIRFDTSINECDVIINNQLDIYCKCIFTKYDDM